MSSDKRMFCGILVVSKNDVETDGRIVGHLLQVFSERFLIDNPDPYGEIQIWVGVATPGIPDVVQKFFALIGDLGDGKFDIRRVEGDAIPAKVVKSITFLSKTSISDFKHIDPPYVRRWKKLD